MARTVYTGPVGTGVTVRRLWRFVPVKLEELNDLLITVVPQTSGFASTRNARDSVGATVAIDVYLQRHGNVDDVAAGDEWAQYIEQVADRFQADRLPDFRGIDLASVAPLMFNDPDEACELGIFESLLRLTFRFNRPVPLT